MFFPVLLRCIPSGVPSGLPADAVNAVLPGTAHNGRTAAAQPPCVWPAAYNTCCCHGRRRWQSHVPHAQKAEPANAPPHHCHRLSLATANALACAASSTLQPEAPRRPCSTSCPLPPALLMLMLMLCCPTAAPGATPGASSPAPVHPLSQQQHQPTVTGPRRLAAQPRAAARARCAAAGTRGRTPGPPRATCGTRPQCPCMGVWACVCAFGGSGCGFGAGSGCGFGAGRDVGLGRGLGRFPGVSNKCVFGVQGHEHVRAHAVAYAVVAPPPPAMLHHASRHAPFQPQPSPPPPTPASSPAPTTFNPRPPRFPFTDSHHAAAP